VLAVGSLPARLAREAIYDIPVVYTMVLDPEKEDLRTENMCGVASNGAFSEQLDVLEQMAPEVKRIGTLFDPARTAGVVKQLREESEEAGYVLDTRAVHAQEEIPAKLHELREAGMEAFLMLLDPGLWTLDAFRIARTFTQEHEIMMIVPDGSMVRAGATFSYAPGFHELGAYAGRLLSNIVNRKVTAADIGVIFPTTRFFTVNPQDVDRYGLRLPARLMTGSTTTEAGEIILKPGG
jgi:putative ABC transport system substrate-binding protein